MSNIKKVSVNLGKQSYPIFIGSNIVNEQIKKIFKRKKLNKIILVTDSNVEKEHGSRVYSILKKNTQSLFKIVLPHGEKTKSFNILERLLEKILSFKINRDTFFVSVGGGVIGDIGGFASSILLRGVTLIHVPTSLLAQVDSAIGGKTGINSKYGKNLIGTFKQPKAVIISIDFLKTLPQREMISGYAEILKYSMISNKEFFLWLNKNGGFVLKLKSEALIYAIKKSCEIKSKIVSRDEKELGVREFLNFGHTFGHAIEASTNYSKKINHGEAIFIGMVIAIKFSIYLNICNKNILDKFVCHLENLGICYKLTDFKIRMKTKEFLNYLKFDKKIKGNKLKFILLQDIGKPISYILENEQILINFLDQELNY